MRTSRATAGRDPSAGEMPRSTSISTTSTGRSSTAPTSGPGPEGAFLLCSFWLVDNLVHRGRVEEALALFESLCARSNPLGLLPEQIDPATGTFLGNFPQALSHVGLVSSAVNLERALSRRR